MKNTVIIESDWKKLLLKLSDLPLEFDPPLLEATHNPLHFKIGRHRFMER
jgi:hypothetical protein